MGIITGTLLVWMVTYKVVKMVKKRKARKKAKDAKVEMDVQLDLDKPDEKNSPDPEPVMEYESLEKKAKELKQQGKGIRRREDEAIDSYGRHVQTLMPLHGVASIYLQLSYPHDSLWVSVMMTILFFFAFGVAFRTALTKLEKISQSTGDLRRRQKDLQEQVKEYKELFRELSRQMRREIAGLEEAIAEAMELSKSKDKQANESSVLLPLAACVVAYGLCFPLVAGLYTSHSAAFNHSASARLSIY
ncbi:uncharacterized protein LOC127797983 [Diospyros lotus]|uniref:uncharacterized protein LOC127797983 n=1 Tax=Diospyros lotus TaxID=55363 RepID=UPI002251C418|nr:uncharacterized protein LOC127797983 [Diospyros lotus]